MLYYLFIFIFAPSNISIFLLINKKIILFVLNLRGVSGCGDRINLVLGLVCTGTVSTTDEKETRIGPFLYGHSVQISACFCTRILKRAQYTAVQVSRPKCTN